MSKKHIKFLLVQINEAHSSAWPLGLYNQPEPHKCYKDRVERAKEFINNDLKQSDNLTNNPFIVRVDGWDNLADDALRLWPDKYYLVDNNYKVLAKAEYGRDADALINVDCIELLDDLLK